ncbi:MAG: hypothetical protein AAGG68_07810 [Bacteroidota bacterium]
MANLPLGQATRDKVQGVAQDLNKVKERGNKLGGLIKSLLPVAAAFVAPQLPLAANIGKVTDLLGGLLNWKPKFPRLGLMDKLGKLFNKGKQLKDQADNLINRSKQLQDRFKQLDDKVEKVQSNIEDKVKEASDIQDQLKKLQQQKDELVQKLEDKPKKILEELQNTVADVEKKANDLVKQADRAIEDKNELEQQLEQLEKEKDDLLAQKAKLEQELEDLKTASSQLEKDAQAAEQEVEAAQVEEEELKGLEQQIEELPSDETLQNDLTICKEELQKLLSKIDPAGAAQAKIQSEFEQIKEKPKKLFDKIKNLKLFQEKLKIPTLNIPIADKYLQKVDQLLSKATAIGETAELLTGKRTKLKDRIEQMDNTFSTIQNTYENRAEQLEQLKGDLIKIFGGRSGLKAQLENAIGKVETIETSYEALLEQIENFGKDSKFSDLNDLAEQLKELKKQQEETTSDIEELDKELNTAEVEEAQLEAETQQVKEEIDTATEQAQEVQAEEEKIKKEFGQEVELEPVTVEEWKEGFEVKREYWDAIFHPDDEVVEGYQGRWFQVRLKDAEKNVKLLFEPGKYFMSTSDFRDSYGSVIGAFVTEALSGIKQSERGEIKLFVQGSADITGQNTFRGRLSDDFMYDKLTILPQKDDSENFSNIPTQKSVSSSSFTNDDLPDLRGNYLKEMISIYSKKLEPILLEGSVKAKESKTDRNAIIYLFIPESLQE